MRRRCSTSCTRLWGTRSPWTPAPTARWSCASSARCSDSVLQGELVMAESQFTAALSAAAGLPVLPDRRSVRATRRRRRQRWPGSSSASSSRVRPRRRQRPAERLAAFHRVENTYLSTFQALGGLGLLLGTIGLATVMFRNVLERRRELALLRAVGYDRGRISMMILAEAALLLGAGLAAGAGCAALAIAPAWLSRGGTRPGSGPADPARDRRRRRARVGLHRDARGARRPDARGAQGGVVPGSGTRGSGLGTARG